MVPSPKSTNRYNPLGWTGYGSNPLTRMSPVARMPKCTRKMETAHASATASGQLMLANATINTTLASDQRALTEVSVGQMIRLVRPKGDPH